MSAMTAMSAIHPVSLPHTADSILPTLLSTAFLRPLKTNNLAISPTMARELLISSSYRTRTDGPVRGGESERVRAWIMEGDSRSLQDRLRTTVTLAELRSFVEVQ